ncbi:putative carboxylesterase [Aspergillus clavatus NRRL 1]|uniref:Carboxylic ester hydrolase n=1 Tax=Aspergillus clavatus (strain ATCC 1007 / CBS 513.65 / DSM 816 / NCTC 3887 / NRRL 1 / QM 1276 / 107) TaxID=344612 RepID=A1CK23_ASPCL|nr:carboxylesterase family protein [Aspergillus clavatus NRRL 1]EAW09497.1 carboxylesterase family protein [Aspergillus clavatus NRRL 1]
MRSLILGALVPTVLGLASHHVLLSNDRTSLTFLYQNNLNASDETNHIGAILLDPMKQHDVRDACQEIGESLISYSSVDSHKDDFRKLFSWLSHSNKTKPNAHFYVREGLLAVSPDSDDFVLSSFPLRNAELPVLCTQTGNASVAEDTASHTKELRVMSEGNSYIGFRDQKSFRFLGIPYADPPQRFRNTTLYSRKAKTIHATNYGPPCAQNGGGSEDCLYLNIQTPYIPKQGLREGLKPVIFWIHGGGFTGGSGADVLTDGGNLASREDLVVVTFNYRLSTLGFLAIPGTDLRGNYGIADQILALEWTVKNIAQFGGDPGRITIIGESAGAGSVRVLLGSAPASGKFQGAIAMSNLGGGVGLGLDGDDATTYSSYPTIDESYKRVGPQIFSELGCNPGSLPEQIACLKKVPASALVESQTVARYVVQDGYYVTTSELNLIQKDVTTSNVTVMFGIVAHDGASFSTYPTTPVKSQLEGIQVGLAISEKHAQRIIDSGLFPYHDTGNVTLDSFNVSQRVATDLRFRCIDQATVFAGAVSGVFREAYYYQLQRSSGGYDPNNLGGPADTPQRPRGDPDLPYFRLHGAHLPWLFGTLAALRDPLDLFSMQLTSAYFAEFVRSGQPNPAPEYLKARGYQQTLDAINSFDKWEPVSHSEGPIQLLDFPSDRAPFQDLAQCEFLGYPITYYFK